MGRSNPSRAITIGRREVVVRPQIHTTTVCCLPTAGHRRRARNPMPGRPNPKIGGAKSRGDHREHG
jgi:hypothetical protein